MAFIFDMLRLSILWGIKEGMSSTNMDEDARSSEERAEPDI